MNTADPKPQLGDRGSEIMTTPNSLPQPSEVVEAVEQYFDALPPKKQRRTRSQIQIDQAPEIENYGPADATPEHDPAALAEFKTLLRQLGETRSTYTAYLITQKIYKLLDLTPDEKE